MIRWGSVFCCKTHLFLLLGHELAVGGHGAGLGGARDHAADEASGGCPEHAVESAETHGGRRWLSHVCNECVKRNREAVEACRFHHHIKQVHHVPGTLSTGIGRPIYGQFTRQSDVNITPLQSFHGFERESCPTADTTVSFTFFHCTSSALIGTVP